MDILINLDGLDRTKLRNNALEIDFAYCVLMY